ncbi:MAG: hypothetical protein A2V65_08890 [Deltaproteobacteria bacterium RBG_13_49_15]|nr:MAG: hypothetical protein A2V65_08890 [Deltaproteobacteria bacterium RBG_13_49_15]
MAEEKILLPYNFTGNDQKALNFVIRTFAPRKKEVEIILFNAFTQPPQIETTRSTVMQKLQSNINFVQQKIKEQEKDLKAAKEILIQSGFPEANIRIVFRPRSKDIASEIVDLAAGEGSTVIVLNRKPGRVSRFFIGSTFIKVVLGAADRTVCVAS